MMKVFVLPMIAALAALLVGPAGLPQAAAGPYDDLLLYVPPDVNTLAMVNLRAAYNSPIAKRDHWADDVAERYRSGVGFIPTNASLVVVAAHNNLTSMTREYQIGLVRVPKFPTAEELARREGGTIGQLGNQRIVLSPRDVYYVTLPAVLAAVYPADRQATARWLRHSQAAKKPPISEFLQKAAAAAGDDVLTVAVDLADAADPALLRVGLSASPTVVKLQTKGIDVPALARLLASVRGLTLGVKLTDKITGTVRLEFDGFVNPFKNVTRELFLELLRDRGVLLSGMEDWDMTTDNTSLTLTGRMTRADLRRVLSLFAFPGDVTDEGGAAAGEVTPAATKRYMAACDVILEDLAEKKEGMDYTAAATWYDTAATRLDQLSRNGVDPVASGAAAEAAKYLRAVAGSLRGVPITKESLAKQAYSQSSTTVGASVGWWGVRPMVLYQGTANTNYPEVRAQWEKTVADDQAKRAEAWGMISQIMGDARRKLVEKYKGMF